MYQGADGDVGITPFLEGPTFAALGHLVAPLLPATPTPAELPPSASPGGSSGLGCWDRLETPPQQPAAAAPALRLCLSAPALAAAGPLPYSQAVHTGLAARGALVNTFR